MGFINLTTFRPHDQADDERRPQSRIEAQVEHTEKVTGFDQKDSNRKYVFLPKTTKDSDLPFIPPGEVTARNGDGSNRLWIVVSDIVLDVTEYIERHPGGRQIILGFGGQDCSWQWWSLHGRQIWDSIAVGLRVGRTNGVENKHERPKQRFASSALSFDDWD